MDPMNIASPEGVTAVAATWLGVRLVLPYLKSIPRVGGFFTGQRVWALVFASAFGVAALEGAADSSESFVMAVTLKEAVAITVAAIGADSVISGDSSDS